MAKRTARRWVWAVVLALAAGTSEAQTVDGVAVDADAELVVAVPDDTNNMDPRIGMGSTRSNYIRQVFESLVDVDAQGKPVPGLALSWKPVNDLTWEFTLRRGVTFHNGEAFNADTVLFNLDRMFRKNLDKWGVKDVTAGTVLREGLSRGHALGESRRLHRPHLQQ
jgi:ABC-type dipeptide transport system, periplasmic component